MSRLLLRAAILAAAVLSAASVTTEASAETWPSRPVRIVNTFAVGGAADILARIAADQLTKALRSNFTSRHVTVPAD